MYVDCIGLLIYLVLFNDKFWFIYVYIYTSAITHYLFFGDLHILLFILHFFKHLTPYIRYQCSHRVNFTLHTVISIHRRQLKNKIQLKTWKQGESCEKIQDSREIMLAKNVWGKRTKKMYWVRNYWSTIWK